MNKFLFTELLGTNGLLDEPMEVEPEFFTLGNPRPLFCWGIFNPMGPTISFIGLLEDPAEKIELIFYRSFNPFSQSNFIVGACDWDVTIDQLPLLEELFETNGNDEFLITNSLPTFFINLDDSMDKMIDPLLWIVYQNSEEDLKEQIELINSNLGKPWDRASVAMNSALKSIISKENKSGGFDPNKDDFTEWFDLIQSDEHFNPELKNFILAWKESIEHQSDNGTLGVFDSLLTFDKLKGELTNTGFELFNKVNI
jgi:hypothetical protein